MITPAIELIGVSRAFGEVEAISGLDLIVPAGSVTVLLGPNGAGKTTTVRLVTGALERHAGELRVLGLDPSIAGSAVRHRCGVVPPKPAFYDRLTGLENLSFSAELYQLADARVEEAAERFGIGNALGQQVGEYSTGMRTRLALARAVLHDPSVLLLDEPTAGLDPESARAVLELISSLAERGRTIVMCTHLLHEAEGIADQVVLMSEGQAWAAGPPAELAGRYWSDAQVHFDAEERSSLAALTGMEGVVDWRENGGLLVELDRLDRLPDIVAQLVASGVRLTRVEPQTPTLEQLYFRMQQLRREAERS